MSWKFSTLQAGVGQFSLLSVVECGIPERNIFRRPGFTPDHGTVFFAGKLWKTVELRIPHIDAAHGGQPRCVVCDPGARCSVD